MKKFFRIVSMLALAGGTLVYTGCTDYSADIDGLKDRVTKLENSSATLASVSTQVESLKTLTSDLSTALSDAKTAIAALQAGSASAADVAALSGKVSSLESAKSTIEAAIETLKNGKADAQTVANLVTSLSGVTTDVATIKGQSSTFQSQIDKLEAAIETLKSGKADVTALDANVKTLNDQIEALNTAIKALDDKAGISDLTALENSIKEINTTIAGINTQIAALDSSKADVTVVNTISETVKGIQTTVAAINTRIDGIEERVAAAEKKIAEITETISSKLDVNTAAATYATKIVVEAVTENVSALENSLKALEEKYDGKIADLDAAVKAAQAAADAAKETANKALTQESFKDILDVYAEKGVLAAKIEALVGADSDNAAAIKANYQEYTDFVTKFGSKVDELIDAALDADGRFSYAELEDDIKDLKAQVIAIEEEIDAIWDAFDTEIRSLELLSDKEYMGKGVVEYEYFTSKAFVEKTESGDKAANGYTFPAAAGWSYQEAEGNVVPKWPTVKVNYRVNPSSVKFSENSQFNFLMRNVTEMATASDTDDKYAGTANFDSYADGVLTVGLKLDNDENGVEKSDISSGKIIRFNLQAVRNNTSAESETSTVTSDAGVLIIKKEDNKTPELYFGKAASVKLFSSVEETNLLSTNLSTVDYSQTINLADSVTTKINGQAYDFKTNAYDFHYKFALVDYGKTPEAGTIDSESNYVESLDESTGVLTPVNSMKSFNRKPLVKVTLNDANDNVLAYGFLPVLIDNSASHISETVAVAMTNTANNTITYTEKVAVGESIYGAVAEESTADFLAKYVLYQGGTGSTVLYVKDNNNFTKISKIGDLAMSGTFSVAGTDTLTVSSSASNLAKIYAQPDHKFTVYVRYVLAADVNKTSELSDNDVLYVPIEITVDTKLSATVGTKISNIWFGEKQDSAYFNVKTPNTGAVLSNAWVTDLNSFWMGNKLQFVVSDGTTSENCYYKFYFAPEQPKVNGIQLVVASNEIKYIPGWTAESSTIVEKNADIVANELFAKYDASGSIYTNNKLYADSVDEANLVATIEQSTGEVTFASTKIAKELLNSSASLPVEDVELYANIGIVVKRNVNNAVVSLGQNTVDKYFFPRPINASNDASAATFEDSDDKSVVSLYDAVDVTDWREATGSFKTADKAWYFAYYGFNKVKISGNIETDLGGKRETLVKVTNKISLKHELAGADKTSNGVTISWNAGSGESKDTDITLPLGDAANAETLAKIKAAFGDLVYTNSGYYIKEPFKLYVPIEMTYVWGTFTFEVEITVNPTK